MATTESTEGRTEMASTTDAETEPITASDDAESQPVETTPPSKPTTGWQGVLIICLCEVFGAIYFLRIGFMIGEAGISNSIGMVFLAMTISLLTILSMSVICQTGEIRSGGIYYMISRILGPTIGTSIGVLYCFARVISISLYLIGFAETVVYSINNSGEPILTGDPVSDARIWSILTLFMLALLCIYTETSSKGIKSFINVLIFVLALILSSIFFIFIGSFYRQVKNEDNEIVVTSKGWSNGNFGANTDADYEYGYGFSGIFLIIFEAFASFTTGADISGDLENASDNIPKGTLLSICISIPIYILTIICVGAVVVREELLTNTSVMFDICVWHPIGTLALYSTLFASSFIAVITTSKIILAMVDDAILFPAIFSNYKIRYLLIFIVALIFCGLGDLGWIAGLITQTFLLTNLLINVACVMLPNMKSNRNIYKISNKCISPIIAMTIGVIGSIVSFIVMIWLDWIWALITTFAWFIIFIIIYAVKFQTIKTLDWNEKAMQYAIS